MVGGEAPSFYPLLEHLRGGWWERAQVFPFYWVPSMQADPGKDPIASYRVLCDVFARVGVCLALGRLIPWKSEGNKS